MAILDDLIYDMGPASGMSRMPASSMSQSPVEDQSLELTAMEHRLAEAQGFLTLRRQMGMMDNHGTVRLVERLQRDIIAWRERNMAPVITTTHTVQDDLFLRQMQEAQQRVVAAMGVPTRFLYPDDEEPDAKAELTPQWWADASPSPPSEPPSMKPLATKPGRVIDIED